MTCLVRGVALGVILAVGMSSPLARAQEPERTLPTLLIKGEVVSLDADDPSATLIKVKDRYGFETPIFVTGQTKFFQGEAEVLKDSLQVELPVEVEYNFDINTAKRYAVVVKLPAVEGAAAATLIPAPEVPPPAAGDEAAEASVEASASTEAASEEEAAAE